MLKNTVLLAAVLASAPVFANDTNPLYAGVVLQSNTIKVNTQSGNAKFEPASTGVVLGLEFADHFALEARALKDADSDEIGPVKLQVKSQFQFQARAHYPVMEQVQVFAAVSFTRSNYEMRLTPNGTGGYASRFALDGAGAAAGVEYLLTPEWRLSAEYQWLPTEDMNDRLTGTGIDIDSNALTFKVSYAF